MHGNHKVNSVQEACAKCFAVHILKFEILQITWKKWNKEHQTLSFQFFINKSSILMFFVLFFMWFARFQILICEPQSIWRKILVLSWLYFYKMKVSMFSQTLAETSWLIWCLQIKINWEISSHFCGPLRICEL